MQMSTEWRKWFVRVAKGGGEGGAMQRPPPKIIADAAKRDLTRKTKLQPSYWFAFPSPLSLLLHLSLPLSLFLFLSLSLYLSFFLSFFPSFFLSFLPSVFFYYILSFFLSPPFLYYLDYLR